MKKIDHRLRALGGRTPEPERAPHPVRVLIPVQGAARAHASQGAQVHSLAGDIATAEIALGDVARLASAAEVIFVELSRGLAQDP